MSSSDNRPAIFSQIVVVLHFQCETIRISLLCNYSKKLNLEIFFLALICKSKRDIRPLNFSQVIAFDLYFQGQMFGISHQVTSKLFD